MLSATLKSRTFTVNVAAGLDVLRATIIVRALLPIDSLVVAEANEERVDSKNVLALCRLAAGCGTEIRFSASGPDAGRAMTVVAGLFAARFRTVPPLPSAPQARRGEGPLGIKGSP